MIRSYACVCATAVLSFTSVTGRAQSSTATQTDASAVLPDYSHGTRAFPEVLDPYRPSPIQSLQLENSPRLRDLIHDSRPGRDSTGLSENRRLRRRSCNIGPVRHGPGEL